MLRLFKNTIFIFIPCTNGIIHNSDHMRITFFHKRIIARNAPLTIETNNGAQLSISRGYHIPGRKTVRPIGSEWHEAIGFSFNSEFNKSHFTFKFREQKSSCLCIVPYMCACSSASTNILSNTFPSHKEAIVDSETGWTSENSDSVGNSFNYISRKSRTVKSICKTS